MLRRYHTNTRLIATALIIITLLTCYTEANLTTHAATDTSNGDWPMFRKDAAHRGITNSSGSVEPEQLWNFSGVPSDGYVTGTSAAVVKGVVYVGLSSYSVGGNIYALDADTGKIIWNYSTGTKVKDIVYSSPAVSENKVYFCADRFVLALDALTGKKIWSFELGTQGGSSPTVLDGVVFVGSDDGNIYALNSSTGLKIWNFTTGGDVSVPAVANGVVYIGYGDSNLYALNATTDVQIWTYRIGSQVMASPVIIDNVLYIGSYGGYLDALNASTGGRIWRFETRHIRDGVMVTAAVNNGMVYVCTEESLQAVNATTGTEIWHNDAFAFYSSPTVADDILYIASYAFNATTGKEILHFPIQVETASPVIVQGVLYIASKNGYLYAIGSQKEGIALTNNNDFLIWVLIIIVILIFAVGLFLYCRKNIKT